MKCILKMLTVVGISTLFFFACAPFVQRTPTPAELEMQQSLLKSFQRRLDGNNNVIPQEEKVPETFITEAEMAKKISLVPAIGQGFVLDTKKDGFDYNGSRFIDPEGVIAAYKCNPATGDTTYFVSTGPNTVTIKWVRVTSGSPAITIAKAQKNNELWQIKTTTGKNIAGRTLTPLSQGILIGRGSTGFIYTPGNELYPISCPDSFQIAQFQNGDIAETGYILIERIQSPKSDKMGSLISSVKNLGAVFGINKKEDYALFNYTTKNQFPINVSLEDKDVSVYSGLKKTHANGLVREYSHVDFFESLYDPKTGEPNSGHYYWRISWFTSKSGPILIVRESGKPKVTALNLQTGKKVLLFERLLGINWMCAEKMPDGKIKVTAKLGLSKETIDDAEESIKTTTNITGVSSETGKMQPAP